MRVLILLLLMPLVLLIVGGVPDDATPYCAPRYRRLCQGKGPHVGCQFPDPGPGANCEHYSAIKFQEHLKHYITHFINRRRQRIAAGTEKVRGGMHLPKPQLMMMVEWDRELATLAQRLADQCNFAHDYCRATVRYPYAGQSVGEVRWRRSSDTAAATARRAIRRVFDAWWGERRRATPAHLTAPFRLTPKGAVWGHFSQLAVWSLRAVGCGAVRHGSQQPRLLLVCDFSHTNMLGQRTITPGPLSRCPDHTERRPQSPYPLLCTRVRYPTPTEHDETEMEADTEEYTSDDKDWPSTTGIFTMSTNITELKTHRRKITSSKDDHLTKSSRRRGWRMRNEFLTSDQGLEMRAKGSLLHKLDRELEVWQKASTKLMLGFINDDKLKPRITADDKRYQLKILADLDENEEDSSADPNKWSNLFENRGYFTQNKSKQYIVRNKWRPTRDRPKRPGATALLVNVPLVTVQIRRPLASLNLDKDDIAQMFKDTGFNPLWLRRPLGIFDRT